MRRGIMAFEEMAVGGDDGGDMEVGVANLEASELGLESEINELNEAQDIHDSVGEVGDQMEKTIESGDGMDEGEARMAEIAVEHFRSRLQYAKKIMPAMEGFSGKRGQLQSTRLALENVRELHTRLGAKIAVAQEGMFDSLKKTIEMVFETEDKVLEKLKTASAAYDAGTPKTEVIESPTWGKYLKNTAKEYSGADAIRELTAIDKMVNDESLKNSVSKLSESLVALTKEIRGNWFVSNKEDIERITAIHSEITAELATMVGKTPTASSEHGVSFTPLNTKEKEKLVTLVQGALSDKSLKAELSRFSGKNGAMVRWTVWQSTHRFKAVVANSVIPLGGIIATVYAVEDTRKAENARYEASSAISAISKMMSARVKTCSAVVSYIQASAGSASQ